MLKTNLMTQIQGPLVQLVTIVSLNVFFEHESLIVLGKYDARNTGDCLFYIKPDFNFIMDRLFEKNNGRMEY